MAIDISKLILPGLLGAARGFSQSQQYSPVPQGGFGASFGGGLLGGVQSGMEIEEAKRRNAVLRQQLEEKRQQMDYKDKLIKADPRLSAFFDTKTQDGAALSAVNQATATMQPQPSPLMTPAIQQTIPQTPAPFDPYLGKQIADVAGLDDFSKYYGSQIEQEKVGYERQQKQDERLGELQERYNKINPDLNARTTLMADSFGRMMVGAKGQGDNADMVLLSNFAKIQNPTIRLNAEGIADIANEPGISATVKRYYAQLAKNERLRPEQRSELVKLANGMMKNQITTQRKLLDNRIAPLAKRYKVPLSEITQTDQYEELVNELMSGYKQATKVGGGGISNSGLDAQINSMSEAELDALIGGQ